MGGRKKSGHSSDSKGSSNDGRMNSDSYNSVFADKGARLKTTPPTHRGKNMAASTTEMDDEWQRQSKRKRRGTSGEHTDPADLSVDDKLDFIMQQLGSLASIERKVVKLDRKLSSSLSDVQEIKSDIKEFELKIKTLEYRAIDQEARGRRNNLLFWGINEVDPKSVENCEETIHSVIKNDLHINDDIVAIQRAHRIGTRQTGKTRPIIVCFRDYSDVDMIMKHVGDLKGTSKGVSRDYPYEIKQARKELYSKFKQYRADPKNKVSIRYPAKLVVNGTTVDDAFPNWYHFLQRRYERGPSGGSKLQDQEHGGPASQEENSATNTDQSGSESEAGNDSGSGY